MGASWEKLLHLPSMEIESTLRTSEDASVTFLPLSMVVIFKFELKRRKMERNQMNDWGLILSEDKGCTLSQPGLWQGKQEQVVGESMTVRNN